MLPFPLPRLWDRWERLVGSRLVVALPRPSRPRPQAVKLGQVTDIQILANGVHERLMNQLDSLSELIARIGTNADEMNGGPSPSPASDHDENNVERL